MSITYPTETAGAEQLDHRVKHARALIESGYIGPRLARFVRVPVTASVLPVCGPIVLNVDYDATTCPERLSDHVRLEREADRFLRFHDGDAMQLDTLRERTRANGVDSTWDSIVKADRVAYRGKARFVPNSHRYAIERVFIVDTQGVCVAGTPRNLTTFVTGRGYKFIGHHAFGTGRKAQNERIAVKRKAARQAQRGAALGTRGKAVDAMSASERSVRRNLTPEQATMATTLESILRHHWPVGGTVQLGQGVTVTVHAATIDHQGRSFPIREGARRLALAGVTVD